MTEGKSALAENVYLAGRLEIKPHIVNYYDGQNMFSHICLILMLHSPNRKDSQRQSPSTLIYRSTTPTSASFFSLGDAPIPPIYLATFPKAKNAPAPGLRR
jgi:hypothetical protein